MALIALVAFGPACQPPTPDPAALAIDVATEYVDGYYNQFPEEAFEVGYPNTPMDRFGDRSLAALQAWESREDAWLATLESIDPGSLEGTEAAIPYAFARWRLEATRARRVCRTELWNASPTFSGWQSILPSSLSQQPVGTDKARKDALSRLNDIPRYLDTEVENLREGVRLGFSAPKTNVEALLRQMDELLATAPEDSPFYSPAERDDSAAFAENVRAAIADNIFPAVTRYRDYLRDEYLAAARTDIAVSSDPGGIDCYRASIRFFTSLDLSPEEIHQNGLRQMERIQAEIREIGRRSFGVEDPKVLFRLVKMDPRYTFRTEDEILDYARAAVDRGKQAVPDWFGFVPTAEVVVRPFPAFMKASGGGFYSAGSADGTRPGTYELGTYRPETISKAGLEATAFHETYAGHHMQVSVGLERAGLHPVLQFFFFSGSGEGWALYTERLADEMGVYSGDVDRLGMLSNEAFRAARLVVDPGMHALGWSQQEAIDYMIDHTAEPEATVTSEVNRYIAMPAQATSYLTGSLEIQRLRGMAADRLGDQFDIKTFHDLIIADGTVTLGMLRDKVERWIAASQVE
ncbi:MAG: DUF885 domain-containing protein [Rhodothermales bacterium]|nr:DUF885 domain-containing protein [Rhodothermales bacterium]